MKEGTTIIGQSIKRGEKNKIYHVYHKRKLNVINRRLYNENQTILSKTQRITR